MSPFLYREYLQTGTGISYQIGWEEGAVLRHLGRKS